MYTRATKRTLAELVESIEREATSKVMVGYNKIQYDAFGQRWVIGYTLSGRPKALTQVDADGKPLLLK